MMGEKRALLFARWQSANRILRTAYCSAEAEASCGIGGKSVGNRHESAFQMTVRITFALMWPFGPSQSNL